MALTSILSELCGDIICTNSVKQRQAVIAETCAKVQRAWEDVSNRLPWHDFCSTEKEKPCVESNAYRCHRCGKRFTSGEVVCYPSCPTPPDTVDGILAECQDRVREHHDPANKSCADCRGCQTVRLDTSKRLRDYLIAAFRKAHLEKSSLYLSSGTIEDVLHRELGGENG